MGLLGALEGLFSEQMTSAGIWFRDCLAHWPPNSPVVNSQPTYHEAPPLKLGGVRRVSLLN